MVVCHKSYTIWYFFISFQLDLCSDGDIRIPGGGSSGRVEVCVNKTWGAICDSLWSYTDASVVCKQLGYSPYGMNQIKEEIFMIPSHHFCNRSHCC